MPGPFGPAWSLALFVALVIAGMVPAARVATVQIDPPPDTTPTTAEPEVGGPCAEWAPLAFGVGWGRTQWPTLSRIMRCESNCDPGAHNPSGASGLLQLMPMWWRGQGDPYDPEFNLSRGLDVYRAQGWRAWSCY